MITALGLVFYALMALVVWDDTSKENARAPGWVTKPTPWARGVFWLPLMLVVIYHLAIELFHEASGALRPRR